MIAGVVDAVIRIVGTVTPDMLFPSTANLVCEKTGAVNAWGFDLLAACSGFLYSLTTGATLIESGRYKKVVVVGADRTLDAAMGEVKRAEAAGLKAEVVRKGDWYRTVVPVDSSAQQQQTLETAKSKVRPGAYVVDYAKWCSPAEAKCVKPE